MPRVKKADGLPEHADRDPEVEGRPSSSSASRLGSGILQEGA